MCSGAKLRGDTGYIDIEVLQKAGINASDIAKLRTAGICTILVRHMTLNLLDLWLMRFAKGCHYGDEEALVHHQRNLRGQSELHAVRSMRLSFGRTDGKDERGRCKNPGALHHFLDWTHDAHCFVGQECGFMTAHEYHVQRQNLRRITTGSKELDKLMGGEFWRSSTRRP
jgi:hypothetical protein